MHQGAPDFEAELKPLCLRAQAGDELACRQALAPIVARLRRHLGRRIQGWPASNTVHSLQVG
jgi:hypothetical protein